MRTAELVMSGVLAKPLIWTSKGNLPVESLTYEHSWLETGKELIFQECWRDETGEVVKNNAHMYVLPVKPKRKPRKTSDVTVRLSGAGIGGQQAAMA